MAPRARQDPRHHQETDPWPRRRQDIGRGLARGDRPGASGRHRRRRSRPRGLARAGAQLGRCRSAPELPSRGRRSRTPRLHPATCSPASRPRGVTWRRGPRSTRGSGTTWCTPCSGPTRGRSSRSGAPGTADWPRFSEQWRRRGSREPSPNREPCPTPPPPVRSRAAHSPHPLPPTRSGVGSSGAARPPPGRPARTTATAPARCRPRFPWGGGDR